MDLKRISLYLAGKLPPYYMAPYNRLEFVFALRGIGESYGINKEVTDEIKEYARNDDEFFFMCLDRLRIIDEQEVNKGKNLLLGFLGNITPPIIDDAFGVDYTKKWRPKDKIQFENIMEGFDEIPATEEVIAPVLCDIFKLAGPRGHKVKMGEFGHDFHIIPYETDIFTRYIGVQVKAGDIGEGDYSKVTDQVITGMDTEKYSSDGEITHPNEMFVITTGKVKNDVREKMIKKFIGKFPNSKLLIWDIEELYQMVLKYGLPQEPIPRKANKKPKETKK